tara:strand:+ start:20767 stop:21855 length:1089 start_codon:yes stop_codon:yes gene_type:complete
MAKSESLSRPTYAEISSENFLHNLNYIRQKVKNPFFCPMVKADAYGHGVSLLLSLLEHEKINSLGVVTIEEAIHLRRLGYKEQILCFASIYKNCKDIIDKYNITPVLSDLSHIDDLADTSVHVELNTAMNRMGIHPNEAQTCIEKSIGNKIHIQGVMSHFANGKTLLEEDSPAAKQYEYFESCVNRHFAGVEVKHLYNTDALLAKGEVEDFGARPGISLYGYSTAKDENLKPVMRLKTRIVKIHSVDSGEGVSYGPIWRAKRKSKIAVLPIGYADGLKRHLSSRYVFECHGQKVSQVGIVCMDYCMIDVTDLENVKMGDVVYVFGNEPEAVYEQARLEKTIPYEILTSISERVPRVLVEKFV